MQGRLNMNEDEIIALAKADFSEKRYGKWRFATGKPAPRPLKDVSESVLEEVGERVVEAYKKLRTVKVTGMACCGEENAVFAKEEKLTMLYNDTIIRLMAEEMRQD